jgi:hypothetical protein
MIALVALSMLWVVHLQAVRSRTTFIALDDMGESDLIEVGPSNYRFEGWITRKTVRELGTTLGTSDTPVTLEIESLGGNVQGGLEAAD